MYENKNGFMQKNAVIWFGTKEKGKKNPFFLGLCPKLWVGGGQKS